MTARPNMDSHEADSGELLHVLDLPQLYQKPSADALRSALDLLASTPTSWSTLHNDPMLNKSIVDDAGVPEYLTRIIASPLAWIENSDQRDAILDLASQRLSERSGRTGMPAMTRSFEIALGPESKEMIAIHEPALTSDNLGLKTWGSAYVLAQQLCTIDLKRLLECGNETCSSGPAAPRVLELGAGTGLVGLSAAAVWRTHVLMTDLPDIVSNLERNISLNADLLARAGGHASSAILDWSDANAPLTATDAAGDTYHLASDACKFNILVAADPIYDPSHPGLLVSAIQSWAVEAPQPLRVLVAYPLRDAYLPQIKELKERLDGIGLFVMEEHQQIGMDDWKDDVLVEWQIRSRKETVTSMATRKIHE